MPELPEVETVRRVLGPHLLGRRIQAVHIYNAQVIAAPAPDVFAAAVTGRVISSFERRGKFLQLYFAGDERLAAQRNGAAETAPMKNSGTAEETVLPQESGTAQKTHPPQRSGAHITLHLRMTGCLSVEPEKTPREKHTHLAFALSDGSELRFEDKRRFGRFWLFEEGEADTSGIVALGPEPFDGALSEDYLKDCGGRKKKSLKELLLDQHTVAGIGNIYADEIAFAAHLLPDRPSNTLNKEEWTRLARTIPERLAYFTEKNAISFEEYLKTRGKDYRNTPYLQVYGRAGMPCPVCGTPLERTVIAGRSSVYCPHCQK